MTYFERDDVDWTSQEAIDALALLELDAPAEAMRVRDTHRADLIKGKRLFNAALKQAKSRIQGERQQRRADEAREAVEHQAQFGLPALELGDNAELASAVWSHYTTRSEATAYDREKVWRYEATKGIFEEITHEEQCCLLQSWSGIMVGGDKPKPLRISATNTIIDMARSRFKVSARPDFFEHRTPGITFSDCSVVMHAGEVSETQHGPMWRHRTALPFAYEPDSDCPVFFEYLRTVFEGQDDIDHIVSMIQQFFGAALFGLAPRYVKRALMLIGVGGTGKSTLLEIIDALFADDTKVSVPPQLMSSDYHGAELEGALLNVVFETPGSEILGEAGFKAIIHGEPITRREIRERPIRFRPEAAHVFAANTLPRAPGVTGAFWDRWLVVHFKRRFRGTDGVRLDIAEHVIKHELPAVAAWLVRGACEVVQARGINISASSRAGVGAWQVEADNVLMWLEECCRIDPAIWTPTADLYSSYVAWSEDAGLRRVGKPEFGRRLAPVAEARRVQQTRGWCVAMDN